MRYELMLPHEIRAAIADNVPVVLPLGVLEYHGEHMAVGMDTLVVTETLAILEQEAAEHAIGRQRDVVTEQRRMRRVRHGAEECAADVRGNVAFHFQLADRGLEAHRTVQADAPCFSELT